MLKGFCALPVAAPTFLLGRMRRSLPSGKTRWPPVCSQSRRTLTPIEGTTHQANIKSGAEKEAVTVEEVIKMKADCAEQKTH
ncbi:hypothetical protein CHARACLAT_015427 [Characodon lateralis]|uniref:Uncharacterized protein n=1 Tax=Characodon lateralis TaxID=208331 RepID=A0ABU7DRR4_9TELE|nr:hypothetical protein [Characodon lateralis]